MVQTKELKQFKVVRVATKDIITDSFQGIRNFFGLRLRGYEGMLNKYIQEAIEEMNLKYEVKWFRMNINPLATNSAMIIIYGEGFEK